MINHKVCPHRQEIRPLIPYILNKMLMSYVFSPITPRCGVSFHHVVLCTIESNYNHSNPKPCSVIEATTQLVLEMRIYLLLKRYSGLGSMFYNVTREGCPLNEASFIPV